MYRDWGNIFQRDKSAQEQPKELLSIVSAQVIDYDETSLYLKKLAQNSDSTALVKELSAKNKDGDTTLHIAVKRGDVGLVKLLISFDASIKIGNHEGKTPEQLAREMLERGGDDVYSYKRIVALINTRGKWQEAVGTSCCLPLNRTIRAVEEAMGKIEGANGQDVLMVVGATREGKSAFINFVSGVDYRVKQIRRRETLLEKIRPKDIEPAKVGDTSVSETLFPGVYSFPFLEYALADMPGYGDTRGSAEEICAAVSTQMLTKQIRGIKGIVLICSSYTIFDDKGKAHYRNTASKVGRMIGVDPDVLEELRKNIIFVLTKPKSHDTVEDVKEELRRFGLENHLDKIALSPEVKVIDKDYIDKLALCSATGAILSGTDNVLIGDVTDPAARDTFKRIIEPLPVRKVDKFNFAEYHSDMSKFYDALERIVLQYIAIEERRQISYKEIDKLQTKIDELNQGKSKKETERKEWIDSKEKPFNAADYEEKIQKKSEEIDKLRNVATTLTGDILRNEETTKQVVKELEKIQAESETKHLVGTIPKFTDLGKKSDLTKKMRGGAAAGSLAGGWGVVIGVIAGVTGHLLSEDPRPVVEDIEYDAAYPISWEQVESLNGSISSQSSMDLNQGKLRLRFRSNDNAFGKRTGYCIKIFTQAKHLPETVSTIKRLESEIQELKKEHKELTAAKDTTQAEIVKQTGEVKSLIERAKQASVEEAVHLRTCEEKVEQLTKEIKEFPAKIKEARDALSKSSLTLEKVDTELEVNMDFFSKLAKIIEILEPHTKLLIDFQKSISSTGRKRTYSNDEALSGCSKLQRTHSDFFTQGAFKLQSELFFDVSKIIFQLEDERVLFGLEPYKIHYEIGNCLFEAIAAFDTNYTGDDMRRLAVQHIQQDNQLKMLIIDLAGHENTAIQLADGNNVIYEGVKEYIQHMSKDQTWGTFIELVALARALRRPIVIFTPNNGHDHIVAEPPYEHNEPIFLNYINNNHYEPLAISGGQNPREILDLVRQAVAQRAQGPTEMSFS